jgi:hypothetical protein
MQRCPYGAPDLGTQQWFLRDRKLDVAEAEEKLARMMRWRREFMPRPIAAADVAEEAATGKAFLHEHPDVDGRPVIVVRARRHVTGTPPMIHPAEVAFTVVIISCRRQGQASLHKHPDVISRREIIVRANRLHHIRVGSDSHGHIRCYYPLWPPRAKLPLRANNKSIVC